MGVIVRKLEEEAKMNNLMIGFQGVLSMWPLIPKTQNVATTISLGICFLL
jgi:hypothetical protein